MVQARKKILCIEDDREAAALIVEELAILVDAGKGLAQRTADGRDLLQLLGR